MLQAKQLHYTIDHTPILQDISLSIASGEIVVILGPNGAGKSTLLHCLTGVHTPQSGDISFHGQPLATYNPLELAQKRAVMTQTSQVTFPFTVMDIVLMGRNPHDQGQNTMKDQEIAEQALKKMDAWHLKQRIFPTLSGGEQQRVQLARVLTQIWETAEGYIFLDEPTSALDLKHQHQLMQHLVTLAKQGMAVIATLHDINLAARYATRLLILKEGHLLYDDLPHALLQPHILEEVFEVTPHIVPHPTQNRPVVCF